MHLEEGLLERAAPAHEGKNLSDFRGHFDLMNAQLTQACARGLGVNCMAGTGCAGEACVK